MLLRGDFHIHSTASDGSLRPWEVVRTASNRGVGIIAITDHNTTNGINEAVASGREYGVSVVPALELSTRYMGESIHLLAYFKDTNFCHPTFQKILIFIKAHKVKEARNILCNFIYSDSLGDNLSIFEGISFLKFFGAAVVLAHPIRISKKYISEILSLPFDGIEAKYCGSSFEDTNYYVNTALSRFPFYTGGSDFHSFQGRCSIGEPYLDELELQTFLQNSGVLVL